MEQHREAVRTARSDGVAGEQQRRAGGGVDGVVDEVVRGEQVGGDR